MVVELLRRILSPKEYRIEEYIQFSPYILSIINLLQLGDKTREDGLMRLSQSASFLLDRDFHIISKEFGMINIIASSSGKLVNE